MPALREDLDFMPSPLVDRPGIFIRDPYRYSEASLIVPPALIEGLRCFDGRGSLATLAQHLSRRLGNVSETERANAMRVAIQMRDALSEAGFLKNERFRKLRDDSHQRFREAPSRSAAHAGAGYPDSPPSLRATLAEWLEPAETSTTSPADAPRVDDLVAIAAPHASPSASPETYAAAYGALDQRHASRTFVILGTSHHGAPNRFGLTRKSFDTPLGRARTNAAWVDELARAAPSGFDMDDYCHAIEHSIEFQVLFLQGRFGPDISIVPILCGPISEPRALSPVVDALGTLHTRHAREGLWVLGVDMAHVGRRYGDGAVVQADDTTMDVVATRDADRIHALESGDAPSFWQTVHGGVGGQTPETYGRDDDLKWCGSAPFYTFLKAVPDTRGQLLRYHQWNIDDASVVTFGAMRFDAR